MEKFCPLNLRKEELIDYTPEWHGERFADGRPKVSDDLLDRMKQVTITEAWGILRGAGYHWQFEGSWLSTHPEDVLVGRALTAMYMPRRPVMRQLMEEKGAVAGCIGDQISWPIDMLVQRDVYVADVFGKIEQGPVIGDNLAVAIFSNSGNGVVHDAAIRDIEGIKEMPGFTSFVRGWHPSYASPTITSTTCSGSWSAACARAWAWRAAKRSRSSAPRRASSASPRPASRKATRTTW